MRAPITHVLGARPNFMKAAPVIRALAALGHDQRVVHTGQHYDERMSEVFFVQLGLPRPDVNLGVGSGSHARQTAEVLTGMEREFTENSPALAVVYGLLYGLVVSEEYSLLMGALALLAVVAVLMYLTRKVDWYAYAAVAR